MAKQLKKPWLFNIFVFVAFCAGPNFTYAKTNPAPDPNELIGKQIVGNQYPDGWKRIGGGSQSKTHDLAVLKNKNVTVFVMELRKKEKVTQVIDIIRIKGEPVKKTLWYTIGSGCKKNNQKIQPDTDDLYVMAEAIYPQCQRYSRKVLNAWLVDMHANKLTTYPTKGLRCANNYLDSGEMSQCAFIPPEK